MRYATSKLVRGAAFEIEGAIGAKAAREGILGTLEARSTQLSNRFDINALSRAGQVLDRSGLTKAGRALDKHGGRPGSVFPKATGNPAAKNSQGQFHLDDILTEPRSVSFSNRFGGRDIFAGDGRGVRIDGEGNIMGFLQPRSN